MKIIIKHIINPLNFFISHIPLISFILLISFLIACEKDIDIVLSEGEEDIVVYGFIEQDLPPIVVLTKSLPVFSTTNIENIQNSFVHNAKIIISDGTDTVQLAEYCLLDLDEPLKSFIIGSFGMLDIAQTGFNYCFYTLDTIDLIFNKMTGKLWKTYFLSIQAEGKTLSAKTTIPGLIPFDSTWWIPHTHPKKDTLVLLWVRYPDPDTAGNFARYFTKRNQEPFYPGYFFSVFTDELINGKEIDFPLERGQSRYEEVDWETYGYFSKGDTIIVKWCSIDKAHYDFWSTLETDRSNSGSPFGTPTKIISNIIGGLGIWGGYGASFDTLVVNN